jgi:energy-converting hydrogenase Eha subunit E
MSTGKIAKYIWYAGSLAVAVGEITGAINPDADDTISEKFKKAPKVIQFAMMFFAGAVFSHFAEWQIRDVIKKTSDT